MSETKAEVLVQVTVAGSPNLAITVKCEWPFPYLPSRGDVIETVDSDVKVEVFVWRPYQNLVIVWCADIVCDDIDERDEAVDDLLKSGWKADA